MAKANVGEKTPVKIEEEDTLRWKVLTAIIYGIVAFVFAAGGAAVIFGHS